MDKEIEVASSLARQAGQAVLNSYRLGFSVSRKTDQSPVTTADMAAHRLIVKGLTEQFPEDNILSEESPLTGPAPTTSAQRLWCVDPLDGTREFIDRNGMFVVMIGLAINGEASVGVIYQPTTDILCVGWENGIEIHQGGALIIATISPCSKTEGAVIVGSRSHPSQAVQQLATTLGVGKVCSVGSVGLKILRIVTGEADLYLSTTNRMGEWDTCAPEAILKAAGGLMTDLRGRPLRYNKNTPTMPYGIIATNGRLHHRCVQEAEALCLERGWV